MVRWVLEMWYENGFIGAWCEEMGMWGCEDVERKW